MSWTSISGATTLAPLWDKSSSGGSSWDNGLGGQGGSRNRRNSGHDGAAREVSNNFSKESGVGPKLRHIPDHGTGKAGKLLRELDSGLELGTVSVTTASAGSSGNTEEELDVLVGAGVLRPVVPDVKVEGVLGGSTFLEVGDTAPVVVELNQHEVERHGVHDGADGSVGEHTLRGGSQVELLAASAVDEAAELLAESNQVVGGSLEIEVETVNNGVSERSVNLLAGGYGAEHIPDGLGSSFSRGDAAPSTLSVGSTTKRDQDGLAVCRLASLDIGPTARLACDNIA